MKYFTDVPYFPAAKNKLHTAIEAAVMEYKRLVFSPQYLPVVQSSILNVIAQLNKEFPRCTIEAKWSEQNISLLGSGKTYHKKLRDHTLWFSGGMYSHAAMKVIVCKEETDL
jgi:hypothetical protein